MQTLAPVRDAEVNPEVEKRLSAGSPLSTSATRQRENLTTPQQSPDEPEARDSSAMSPTSCHHPTVTHCPW